MNEAKDAAHLAHLVADLWPILKISIGARPIPLLAEPVVAYTDTDTVLEGSIGDSDTDTVMSRK